MDVQTLIDLYTDDVTRRLPRKQRADVGDELRALLAEELHGKTPEEATSALRAFGRPADVAARYHPAPAIIDPADTRAFLIAAIAGLAVLSMIGAPAISQQGRDTLNLSMLGWVGLLTVWFGVKSWMQRRWPATNQWRPRDRARAPRAGTVALIFVILLGIVCFGAPAWVFALLTGGKQLSPWLAYTDDFQSHRLPVLLAIWGAAALLQVMLLIEGRWRRLTRDIDITINVAVLLTLSWYRFGPAMFVTPQVDTAVRGGIAVAVGIVLIDTAMKIYNKQDESGRVPRAA